jgi:hypothetical protein
MGKLCLIYAPIFKNATTAEIEKWLYTSVNVWGEERFVMCNIAVYYSIPRREAAATYRFMAVGVGKPASVPAEFFSHYITWALKCALFQSAADERSHGCVYTS